MAIDFVNLINAARAELGRNPLTLDSNLNAMSKDRAKQLKNDYSHNGQPKEYGEVLAMNISWTEENAEAKMYYTQWKNSQGHWDNLMNPNYTTIGFAASDNRVYGCALLGFGEANAASMEKTGPTEMQVERSVNWRDSEDYVPVETFSLSDCTWDDATGGWIAPEGATWDD